MALTATGARAPRRFTGGLQAMLLVLLALKHRIATTSTRLLKAARTRLYQARMDYGYEIQPEPAGRVTRAHNMVGVAIEFGVGLMVTVLMILVVGLFIANVPTSGAFSGVLDTAQNIGGAGFVIVVVTLLVVPVIGLISYFAGSGIMSFARGRGR